MLDTATFGSSCDSLPAQAEREVGEVVVTSPHDPNRLYRRESVVASWRAVRREREAALGGGGGVRRSRSERSAELPRQAPVKRACSVLHRYDAASERVVKEYRYRARLAPLAPAPAALAPAPATPAPAPPAPPAARPPRPSRRSLTALLKSRILAIFTG